MKNLITMVICVSLLTGCSLLKNQNKSNDLIQERVINIPLEVPGIMLSESDSGRLRTGENIKSYYIGRLVDPDNPDILYPSGEVYEVIDKPRWIKTPRPVKLPSGVPTRLTEDRQSGALIAEFKNDMMMIKESVNALKQSRSELNRARIELGNAFTEMKKVLDKLKVQDRKFDQIKTQVESISQKVAELENKSLFSNSDKENTKK